MASSLRHPLHLRIPADGPLEPRPSDLRLPMPMALDTAEGPANLNHRLRRGEALVDHLSDGVAGSRAGEAAAC